MQLFKLPAAQLLLHFDLTANDVFEPKYDAIPFGTWNMKIGMRVLEQHASVVIKGAMQHAASAAAFYSPLNQDSCRLKYFY